MLAKLIFGVFALFLAFGFVQSVSEAQTYSDHLIFFDTAKRFSGTQARYLGAADADRLRSLLKLTSEVSSVAQLRQFVNKFDNFHG
jgi:hypothetical protein